MTVIPKQIQNNVYIMRCARKSLVVTGPALNRGLELGVWVFGFGFVVGNTNKSKINVMIRSGQPQCTKENNDPWIFVLRVVGNPLSVNSPVEWLPVYTSTNPVSFRCPIPM